MTRIHSHSRHLTAAAFALLALAGTALATPSVLAGPAAGGVAGTQVSPYSGPEFDVGAVVGLRREQQAQYVVDHALELGLFR